MPSEDVFKGDGESLINISTKFSSSCKYSIDKNTGYVAQVSVRTKYNIESIEAFIM